MQIPFLLLFLLSANPVFLLPASQENNTSAISTETPIAVIDQLTAVEEAKADLNSNEEEATTAAAAGLNSTNISSRKRRPNKRPSDNNRRNQLNQSTKRQFNRKRRPLNGKKGSRKTNKRVTPIVYQPRSVVTDQLNQVIDNILANYSQHLTNETFSLKVSFIPTSLKVKPWSYLARRENNSKPVSTDITPVANDNDKSKFQRRNARENVESKVEDSVDLEADDLIDDLIVDEDTQVEVRLRLEEEESETTKQQPNDEQVKVESSDDDEDDDEELMMRIEETSEDRNNKSESEFTFSQNPVPSRNEDGVLEYHFQLLSEEDLKNNKDVGTGLPENHTDENDSSETLPERGSRRLKDSRKASSKNSRKEKRRFPRRSNARVEGLDQIKRMDDALIGSKNNSSRIIDVPIRVGPIQFIMKDSATVSLRQSRVSSPALKARLRLTEVEGKIVSARLKPVKIRSKDAIVTLQRRDDQTVPTKLDSARLVNHLSQEMSRIWNSGYLLQKIGRRFKQLVKTDRIETTEIVQLLQTTAGKV